MDLERGKVRPIKGGYVSYGQLAGVLMLGSTSPRAPGDLGHAMTFDFPVRHGAARTFPFSDLVEGNRERLDLVVEAVQGLEQEGVRFVAADCGLFSVFHQEISQALTIPFLSSSLMLIPWLKFLYPGEKIGVLTGDTRILKEAHLKPVGATLEDIVMEGLEYSAEFNRVVIEHGDGLELPKLGRDALEAARKLKAKHPGIKAVILECTNLISFRTELQKELQVPVYDMLTLVNFVAEGFRFKKFAEMFI